MFARSCGILLHPVSLPGPYGVGDIGRRAVSFLDWLKAAGQKVWQVLPLGPTGYGDSPYQCLSAFAGNPLLIGLDELRPWVELPSPPAFDPDRIDYGAALAYKMPLLRTAAERFLKHPLPEYAAFAREQAGWLDDFARFAALKDANGGAAWTEWTRRKAPAQEIEIRKVWQFWYFLQWRALRRAAAERGIAIMGDLPIYVAHDSVDVERHPELFCLRRDGRPALVAGVPPDYFSATGQRWGNPIYRWDELAKNDYAWWIGRLRAAFDLFDFVRLDHFRGFEAYWQSPAEEETAVNGEWVRGPGATFFESALRQLGRLPLVAENLGVITEEVEALRHRFGFPGMTILQFAFGNDPQARTFQPHNYERNLVAYTGTHDNDTVVGWWNSRGEGDSIRTPEDVEREHAFARAYLDLREGEIHWAMIRTLLASVAGLTLIPMQDVLGLGSEARMNQPATTSGNWQWRLRGGALRAETAARLEGLCRLYER